MKEIKGFRDDYYFLSNFYCTHIYYKGKPYQNTEAAFQAQKTLDETVQWSFCGLSPRDARAKGKMIELRPDWEEVKEAEMKAILDVKFSKPEYKEKLLSTGDAFLEETNGWHDNYWGNCICDKCKGIPGKNTLGKLLMQVREEKMKEDIEYGR